MPQKSQGHHCLSILSYGFVPCKYYDLMYGHRGIFTKPKDAVERTRDDGGCNCPSLDSRLTMSGCLVVTRGRKTPGLDIR